ncbi:MAG: hypothetical protein HRT35_17145 [Algicola sp.]|nr:hypothetical protein [Algicola sp.]
MSPVKTLLLSTISMTLMLTSTTAFAEATANNCAVLSTKKSPKHRDKAPLILTSHNGKHLFGINKKLTIPDRAARGSASFGQPKRSEPKRSYYKLVLEPGIHHFTAYVQRKRMQPAGTEFSFAINVEPGTFYKLIGQRAIPRVSNPRKEFEPVVFSTKYTDCDTSDFKTVYKSVGGNATAKTEKWAPTFAVNMNQDDAG